MRPTIGVDIDGVLCDMYPTFFKIAYKLTNKKLTHTHYKFEECGLTEAEVNRIWNHIRHTYNFYETLNPLPNTKQLMRWQDRFNPIFITSRVSTDGGDVVTQTSNWLERNYGIRDAYVVVSHQKGPTCKELGVEFFIDDKVENCVEVVKHSKETKVYVQSTPCNLQFSGKGIQRVDSVNDFLAEVLKAGAVVSPPRPIDQKSQRANGRKKPRLRGKR